MRSFLSFCNRYFGAVLLTGVFAGISIPTTIIKGPDLFSSVFFQLSIIGFGWLIYFYCNKIEGLQSPPKVAANLVYSNDETGKSVEVTFDSISPDQLKNFTNVLDLMYSRTKQ